MPKKSNREFFLLNFLKYKHILTPKPIFLDISGEIINYPFIILEFIEGKCLLDLTKNKNINLLALTLVNIHKIVINENISSIINNHNNRPSEIVNTIMSNQDIPKKLKVNLLGYIELQKETNQKNLIHGDY